MKFEVYGDKAILITFSEGISEEANNEIIIFIEVLKNENIGGVENWIPAYNTLVLTYNPLIVSYVDLVTCLKNMNIRIEEKFKGKLIRIPVCYEEEFALDIQDVISKSGLSKSEIIEKHTSPIYKVHMIGFMPGFFYLGGLDENLICERKTTPRIKIEKGSVGIGGKQTGVYSLDGPGGWQIIGKTPMTIFDKENVSNPFLVKQGDEIQFYQISLETFNNFQNG
jgi:inhibitor of KinA